MKHNGLKFKIIIAVAFLFVAVFSVICIKKNLVLNKTYGYETGITNIAQFVDEENNNATSASFILDNLDPITKETLIGHKVKIYSNDENITLTFLNSQTNDELEINNGIVTLDNYGTTVKVNGISKGNNYDINITPVEVNRGYMPSFKSVKITLDYSDLLSAYVSEIIDIKNEPVDLSNNDKIVFLYTDNNDKIKLRANEDVDIKYYYSLDELSDEELSNVTFNDYDKNNYLKVETNGYLYAKAKYKTEAYSKISMLHVTNIDKINPIISEISHSENDDYQSATLNFTVNDGEATKEYGKSGISKYIVSKHIQVLDTETWTDAVDGSYSVRVEDNATYYIHTLDNAGNKTVEEVRVDDISFNLPGNHVLILESTKTELVGKVYPSLMKMKEDFDLNGLTNSDIVVAQIEADLNNQFIDVENVNLTIDLNGYVLESRNDKPTFNIKDGAKLTIVDNKYEIDNYLDVTGVRDFSYTGKEVSYVAYDAGTYKIEAWGAQGGRGIRDATLKEYGGYGAYAVGEVYLDRNQKLYINVGGKGENAIVNENVDGGYNGGGKASADWDDNESGGGGGGASSIATSSGQLRYLDDNKQSIVMVAAGGGGASWYAGGHAGGVSAPITNYTSLKTVDQNEGYMLGQGESAPQLKYKTASSDGIGGAGGGWYGGYTQDDSSRTSGQGGSSYIGSSLLSNKSMYCYSCTTSDEESTKTISVNSHSTDPIANTPKEGDGYVRITRLTNLTRPSDVDYTLFEHGSNYGTVKNINSDAININPGGVLQVGEDNSPDLAHVEYPNHNSPYISGKDKGITNRGTFDYYDGVVFGGVAIDGDVQNSPYIYDPNIRISDNGSDFIMTLEKVTNIEAMIGKTRYTLLEDAIDVANRKKGTPEDQIKIDIVSDLAKELVIEVNDQKNIILDLNGHTFTNVISQPIIENYGKCVIMDSGENGVIVAHTSNTILNHTGGEFTLNSGIIYNDHSGSHTIYNEPDAKVTTNGGKVIKKNTGNTYHNLGGELHINGGINSGSRNRWDTIGDDSNVVYNIDYASTEIADNEQVLPLSLLTDSVGSGVNRSFVQNEDGSLSPEGLNERDTISEVQKMIDLSSMTYGETVQVEFDYEYNLRYVDAFYVYTRSDADTQSYSSNTNRLLYVYNSKGENHFTATFHGGQIVYIHFGFHTGRQGDTFPEGGNVLKIKNLKVRYMHYYKGKVDITGGKFDSATLCNFNKSYFDNYEISGGTFYCVYSADTQYGNMYIKGGLFESEVRNDHAKTMFVSGGDIKFLHNFDGTVRMSGGRVQTFHNKHTDGHIEAVYSNTNNYAYITGGEIYGTCENYQYMDIKNAYITGVVKDYSKQPMSIENTTFEMNLENKTSSTVYSLYIESDTGNITMKDNIFNASIETYKSNQSVPVYNAIYKTKNATITSDGLTMNLIGIDGFTGTHNTTKYRLITGIYNTGNGDITLDKTIINTSTNNPNYYSYGIYNLGKANITIGNKDNNYHENEYYIKGTQAIYNPQTYIKLYDGYLAGSLLATNNTINDIEDNYYVYRYDNDGVDTIKLTTSNIGNVLNVDTNVTYNTLSEALDAAGDSAKLRFINKYNYETHNRTYEIKSNQNIILDLNGKEIYLGTGLINNGILKVIDESNEENTVRTQSFINNNVMSIEAGNWIAEIEEYKGIINNGKLTIKNAYIVATEMNNNEGIIDNNGQLFIEDGTIIDTKSNVAIVLIRNQQDGIVTFNGGTLNANNSPDGSGFSIYGRLVYNNGGNVIFNNGTFNSYSESGINCKSNGIVNSTGTPDGFVGNNDEGIVHLKKAQYSTIPIDISSYTGDVNLIIQYDADGSNRYWMSIDESSDNPSGTFTKLVEESASSGAINDKIITTTLQGGKKYYLHAYITEGASSTNLYITSVNIEQNENIKEVIRHGNMIVNGGTFNEKNGSYYANIEYLSNYNAYLEINNGTFTSTSWNNHGIYNYRDSKFKMTGGTIENKNYGILFNNYSSGTITGGTVHTKGYALNVERGYVDISNININVENAGDANGIYLKNDSTLNMTGGTINITESGNNVSGLRINNNVSASVSNVTMNVKSTDGQARGIWITNTSAINLSNTSISVEAKTQAYGINSTSSGTINNTNVTINATSPKDAYAIQTESANKITINQGSYIANAPNSYGYVSTGSNAPDITISNEDGDADGNVSKTSPLIQGNTYGLYRGGGTLKFYDGIFKGATQLYGGVNDRPEGYELVTGNDGTLNTLYLDKKLLVENVDTEVQYASIEAAVTDCTNDQTCNLRQIYDISLRSGVEIPSNKIINYDINNHTLGTTETKYITNKGTITFTNGTLEAQSVQNLDPIIENYGSLTIGNNTVITTGICVGARVFYNHDTGNIYINGGTITATSDPKNTRAAVEGRIIYNEGGYIEINGGTITGFSYDYTGYARSIYNISKIPEDYKGSISDGNLYTPGNTNAFPVDLTGYTGNVELQITLDASNGSGYKSFVSIDESEENPTGTFDKIYELQDGSVNDYVATTTVQGGKKYYLHFNTSSYAKMYVSSIKVVQGSNQTDLIKHGRIIINNGTIIDLSSDIMIKNINSYLEINNGTIKSNSTIGTAVVNYRDSIFKMTDGTIENKTVGIKFVDYSHGTITGGDFTISANSDLNDTEAIFVEGGYVDVSNIDIDFSVNSSVHKYRYAIRADFESIVNIDNVNINVSAGGDNSGGVFVANSANVTINNSTITTSGPSRSRGIILGVKDKESNSSNVTINNSTINTTCTTVAYGIYSETSGNVSINNSTITATSDTDGVGLKQTNSNIINVNNSTIKGYGTAGYGIQVTGENKPNITISNNDVEVSTSIPYIYGDLYGIYRKGGELTFMDGKIEGTNDIYGGITYRPDNYQLRYSTNNGHHIISLDKLNWIKNTDTGVEYDNLQSAFNNCIDNTECNLQQIYNINNFEIATISANKIINYDLNNLTLSIVNMHNIVNYGSLKFSDGTIESQSVYNAGNMLDNYGKLYIENGTLITTLNYVGARMIYNRSTGELYINGGELRANQTPEDGRDSVYGRIIYNEGGYVEINGGSIIGNSREHQGFAQSIYNIAYSNVEYTGTTDHTSLFVNANSTRTAKIDLSDYSGDVLLQLGYDVLDTSSSTVAWASIDENESNPSGTFDKLFTENGYVINQKTQTVLQGGKVYYLHIHAQSSSLYVSSFELIQGSNKKELIKHGYIKQTGGTITDLNTYSMIMNYNSTYEMTGGTITSDSTKGTGVDNCRDSVFKMSGGTISNKAYAILFANGAIGEITGGAISSLTEGNVNVVGIDASNAKLDISNLTINLSNSTSNSSYLRRGIALTGNTVLNMSDSNVTVGGLSTTYGIYMDSSSRSNVTLKSNVNFNISSDNNSYGIYDGGKSTITLGENDGLVDKNKPHITSNSFGVYLSNEDSVFNFYDGRITSTGVPIRGSVDETPTDYQIQAEFNDYYLEIRSVYDDTFEYNKMYFQNINMPIEIIKRLDDKTGTIKLWNDTTIHSQIEIPEGLDITIALEGHHLEFEDVEVGIINNGTLRIIDGYGEEIDNETYSTITNLEGTVIDNQGTLVIGASGNPNSHSPVVKGKTAYTGNNAQVLSGKAESTESGIIQNIGSFLLNLLSFNFVEPSYSYKTNDYQVYRLPDATILATSPNYRSIESLEEWTNKDINIGVTSHNIGILNLIGSRNPDDTKEVKYRIEVYKNGVLDEFYSFNKTANVQYLEENIIMVDLDWFDDVEHKFKDYFLTKMTVDNQETTVIPEYVNDGTVIRLYYGQVQGQEIVLVNPKTGRRSTKYYFLVALILSIIIIAYMMTRYIKNMSLKEDTL